jgi:hypothetical protein
MRPLREAGKGKIHRTKSERKSGFFLKLQTTAAQSLVFDVSLELGCWSLELLARLQIGSWVENQGRHEDAS